MKYTELHCKTNFSFLEGASHADELVERAVALGYRGLAITDRNSVAGVVRAHTAAKANELALLIGAEIHLQDAIPVVLWVTDRIGYGRLCRLLTTGRRRAPKGQCELTFNDLAAHDAGLLAGVITPQFTATHPSSQHIADCHRYRELFGDRAYLLLELHRGVDDAQRIQQLRRLSVASGMPLVAGGDVLYHSPARLPLHDVMVAIRHGAVVDEASEYLQPNAQHHLRSLDELAVRYTGCLDALERTSHVADRCHFSLDELRYEYPEELAPLGLSPQQYLTQLTWEGAHRRYPHGIPDKVKQLLEHELTLITDLSYEAYFLTVWDLVRFARSRGILCQGRGSAANSAVCYCLGVTAVDPTQADLLFERFVSRERNEAPDIDIDFEHERREEVLQYLYDKYGRDRAGLAAEVITYRVRSAVRDVGKALGLSLDRVDALAKQVEGYATEPNLADRCRQVGIDPDSQRGARLVHLVNELIGFPRHLGQHVGGMVMTRGPLCELVPIENAAMADRTVISWDKHDLDDLGILKVDCLALGMLTAIRKAFQLVRQHHQQHLTLANIPQDDPQVYDMICRADTMGVFQIESRAQMSMLPRLRPRCYYDLVVEVAIVRPGPIQGQMVHPYLRRRMGLEPVDYPNDEIRDVLHKTLGIPIFQEQAMRLAVVAAGFTPGEADQLRRAMGAWRRSGVIDQFRQKLMEGMQSRGLSIQFAEQVFQQIRGFGEYGFPESHAASFALLVYISAWIKHYHPAAFAASLINSQPMGFYAPAQLIRDARQHGVTVRPIDVNHSDWDCTLETDDSPTSVSVSTVELQPALRLGMRLIHGLSVAHAHTIVHARGDRPFQSMHDLARRTQLPRSVVMRLSEADAFRTIGQDRRHALWEAMSPSESTDERPLFRQLAPEQDSRVNLPQLDPLEQVFADYRTTGVSLKAHPMSFYRPQLKSLRVATSAELGNLGDGRWVRVAGLVLLRQRPSTAKGITFVTLEDETGVANLVVRQPIWERYYPVARRSPAWIAHGRLECRHSVVHLLVHRLEDLSAKLRELKLRSRDFR